MKSKQTAGGKKQSIVVNDLKAKKNPKGGTVLLGYKIETTGSIVQPTTKTQGFFLK
jgi:predicted alpha/beta-hydrolase family hydrolase